MEPSAVALTPSQAAALVRAEALAAELVELVGALRARRPPRPVDARPAPGPLPEEATETLAAGDLRRAFTATAGASRRRPRWARHLLG